MPAIMIFLTEGQLHELDATWGLDIRRVDAGMWEALFQEPGSNDLIGVDSAGDLDRYVLRCIGTVQNLEEHQRQGGYVLLRYPDRSLRHVVVDTTQDHPDLPTAPPPGFVRAQPGRVRRIRVPFRRKSQP
jgi:hypothetical protein